MDPNDVESKITSRTKAIVVVHYAGQCADMDPILEISRRHKLKVIEDATEAHGAEYQGRKSGSLGDIACFSFTANKNMTTGEGGMVTTNDRSVADRIRLLRTHGQSQPYYHTEIGYNYRMTDFQAALGLSQLRKLPETIAKKRKLARRYEKEIRKWASDDVAPPLVGEGRTHTYMLYTIRFRNTKLRDYVMGLLDDAGIQSRIAFPPIHRQPQYKAQYRNVRLPNTERIAGQILSLPIFTDMSMSTQDEITEALKRAVERFHS
jgi:dTDP-4-amino-4,6-dideoxygalactose transaminase